MKVKTTAVLALLGGITLNKLVECVKLHKDKDEASTQLPEMRDDDKSKDNTHDAEHHATEEDTKYLGCYADGAHRTLE